MTRTIFFLLTILILTPAVLRAQEGESLFNGWGLGFQVGVGGMVPTGSLADDFKGCALFTGGLNTEHNRLRIKADKQQRSRQRRHPYPFVISFI